MKWSKVVDQLTVESMRVIDSEKNKWSKVVNNGQVAGWPLILNHPYNKEGVTRCRELNL